MHTYIFIYIYTYIYLVYSGWDTAALETRGHRPRLPNTGSEAYLSGRSRWAVPLSPNSASDRHQGTQNPSQRHCIQCIYFRIVLVAERGPFRALRCPSV